MYICTCMYVCVYVCVCVCMYSVGTMIGTDNTVLQMALSSCKTRTTQIQTHTHTSVFSPAVCPPWCRGEGVSVGEVGGGVNGDPCPGVYLNCSDDGSEVLPEVIQGRSVCVCACV